MRVEKSIDVVADVMVDIDLDDITAAIWETEGAMQKEAILHTLNNMAKFLKALPDEIIAELNAPQRQMVKQFFETQAKRFAEQEIAT